jgi:hypothetical protein
MRRALLLATLAACGSGSSQSSDPCDSFIGRTCIAVHINCSDGTVIDQVELIQRSDSTEVIAGGVAYTPGVRSGTYMLPASFAVLPPSSFKGGSFDFDVHVFDGSNEIGCGNVSGSIGGGMHTSVDIGNGGGCFSGCMTSGGPPGDMSAPLDMSMCGSPGERCCNGSCSAGCCNTAVDQCVDIGTMCTTNSECFANQQPCQSCGATGQRCCSGGCPAGCCDSTRQQCVADGNICSGSNGLCHNQNCDTNCGGSGQSCCGPSALCASGIACHLDADAGAALDHCY